MQAKIFSVLQCPRSPFTYVSKNKLHFLLHCAEFLKKCFLLCYCGGVLSLNSIHITLTMVLANLKIFCLCSFPFFWQHCTFTVLLGHKMINVWCSHYFWCLFSLPMVYKKKNPFSIWNRYLNNFLITSNVFVILCVYVCICMFVQRIFKHMQFTLQAPYQNYMHQHIIYYDCKARALAFY